MRIAILGATSQIAQDLIESFAVHENHTLVLYARRTQAVYDWLERVNLLEKYKVKGFDAFGTHEVFDVIINFVGVGNPEQAAAMGASIFDVTNKYDEMAMDYVRKHQECRYIFLSSGAAYGARFDSPVDGNTVATVPINNLKPQDWYGVAKLYAECKHRAHKHLPIIDVRIFNYFSASQDLRSRFFICDILRSIKKHEILKTSSDNIIRDYLHSIDFYKLICCILISPASNDFIDAYTRSPIDKFTLLQQMEKYFALKYYVDTDEFWVNATGNKKNYYSLNKHASTFGYEPTLTSLDGLMKEAKYIIEK